MTITVSKAPPFATIQDLGWSVGRAWGLPRGGAMDRVSLVLANLLVGNEPGAAAIEWALGPGELEFADATYVAVAGGAEVVVAGRARRTEATLRVRAGDRVRVTPTAGSRFGYIAIRSGIDVPAPLGSRSTYLPAGIGGLSGRRLKLGDVLSLGPEPETPPPAEGVSFERPAALRTHDQPPFGILPGPHHDLFSPAAKAQLARGTFRLAPTSDRMGIRLEGPPVVSTAPATLPSEGVCIGSMQIPSGGMPIVVMPDGPTVGGYPQAAVVIRAHLSRFAQQPPGANLTFRWMTLAEARLAADEEARALSIVGRALRRPLA
ncbi:MAG: biotin-dependent carboxyltransferase family protein [Gemmatimonadota bacterium]